MIDNNNPIFIEKAREQSPNYQFYLAPMAELSHRALRELIWRFFQEIQPKIPVFPVFYTEMISAQGLFSGGPFEKWYLDNEPCPQSLVYQLLGADEEQLVKAAALLDSRDCLGIDINMGCSAPAITRTGAGVRWMEDPDKAALLIEKLRKVTKKRLSVKLRLAPKNRGLGERNEERREKREEREEIKRENEGAGLEFLPYLVRFCKGMEAAGLDLIVLHPRTGDEKFKRKARWEYVYALRKALSIPVVGNGDIESAQELAEKAAQGPVMAGRLLVKEPWAFARAALLADTNRRAAVPPCGIFSCNLLSVQNKSLIHETALSYLELLSKYQPPEFHLSRARRFFLYYCGNLSWAEYMRNTINRQESLAGIEKVWTEYFREQQI